MLVRIAIGLGVGALFFLICWWLCTYKREWLKDVFGLSSKKRSVDAIQIESGQAKPAVMGKVGTNNGGTGPTPGAMIVVTADDRSRGEVMEYRSLADACSNWSDANILGKGAAAIVYQGTLPRFGQVAIKRFHQTPAGGLAYNFDRELDALCQCRHPHVLEILGKCQTGPEQLIVMPLMEGGCLTSAIPAMSWAPRADCLGQVVTAVSFLHSKKMVHRDIKSSNILLDRMLRHARLADFGLAKDQVKGSRHGTTGIVVGSPGYMAPELMMRPANEKTDAFALGVVLLEILTGQAAWDEARDAMALGDAAVTDRAFQVSMLDPAASWPEREVQVLGNYAVLLTSFDPNQRVTLASMEQSLPYQEHLTRAKNAAL